MKQDVVIVQRRLTHYRVPLFELLKRQLAEDGVRLRLLHGDPMPSERSKQDSGSLDWALHLPTKYWMGGKLMWQPFMHLAADAALVIVTQENKHLHNVPAMLNPWRRHRMAFWGHGRNMQTAHSGSPREAFKRWMTRQPDWWFAYTEISRQFVEATGYAPDRITVLNNSVDTSALRTDVEWAQQQGKGHARKALGVGSEPLACFIGSLYPDKHLDFLLKAADQIHAKLPGFRLLIAGAGPQQAWLEESLVNRPHVRYVGPVRGQQKAQLLVAADVMLNPGLVGLGILDAFVAGIPMLTTDCRIHSPEIAYLEHGHNGLMTAPDASTFAELCVGLLSDASRMKLLGDGAKTSGDHYSVQAMATRFRDGIMAALASP